MLNAGRGNPNWIATEPREAFFLLGQFGLCECRHAFSLEEGIAGIPQKAGIAARFEAFLKENEKAPGANLLKEGYNYMLMEHAADPDTLIHEWAESVIGDQYPVPDRWIFKRNFLSPQPFCCPTEQSSAILNNLCPHASQCLQMHINGAWT